MGEAAETSWMSLIDLVVLHGDTAPITSKRPTSVVGEAAKAHDARELGCLSPWLRVSYPRPPLRAIHALR